MNYRFEFMEYFYYLLSIQVRISHLSGWPSSSLEFHLAICYRPDYEYMSGLHQLDPSITEENVLAWIQTEICLVQSELFQIFYILHILRADHCHLNINTYALLNPSTIIASSIYLWEASNHPNIFKRIET